MYMGSIKRLKVCGCTYLSRYKEVILRAVVESGDRNMFERLLQEIDIYEKTRDGKTALMLVVENGHLECLKCLVDANKLANINQCDEEHKRTALMVAAMNGHTECVRCLIDTGRARVNLYDSDGLTALMLAAKHGHAECLTCLLDSNMIENLDQKCAVSHITALIFAAMNGHIECVRRLMDTGRADVNLCDLSGYTAFMYVASNGHVEILKYLMDTHEIENINQRDSDNQRTALMMAAMNGHNECVRCLIDTGQADVNLCDREDYTALMRAAENGHYECVKCLTMTEGIAFHLTDRYGRTALILAAERGYLKCIECLIWRGDIDINDHDYNKTTAFMMAAQNGHTECVRLILSHKMLELNASNKKGHTAFMLASKNGHIQCVKLLLSHDKVDVNIRDIAGHTALMLAILESRDECVKSLISNEKVNVVERDNAGRTAFMFAAKWSNVYCLEYFLKIIVTKEMEMDLINNDNESYPRENQFATAFSRPYTDNSVRYFPGITWRRPYIHGRDQEGKSVLKLVIRNGLPRCIVCFLLAGRDVVLSENVSCSHTLIDKGELSGFDYNGQTSLIAAVQTGHYESMDYLLQYERIRFHTLVIVLREEFRATGTISLLFYKKLCSLIQSLKEADQLLCMICNGEETGVCVDYLLSAFVCHIDSCNQSTISLAISWFNRNHLKFLLDHVSEKNILFNHIKVTCKQCPIFGSTFPSLLQLLEFNIFLWNWYPIHSRNRINILTRELVTKGFAPGCFEWQGKQYSPMHFAFWCRDRGRIRYLMANLYLTSRDLEHIQRDTEIRGYLQRRGSEDLNQLYQDLFDMPWRLETHSLLTISNWLRNVRNQDGVDKIYDLLPEIFRSRLSFTNPMRLICLKQWRMIDLNFMNQRLLTTYSGQDLLHDNCCNGGCLKFSISYEDIDTSDEDIDTSDEDNPDYFDFNNSDDLLPDSIEYGRSEYQ